MNDNPQEIMAEASATAKEMMRLANAVAEQSIVPPTSGGTVVVITGSFAEYLNFLKEADIQERKAAYVHNIGGLKAFIPGPWTHVVLCGEYWLNPIFSDEYEDTALFYLELHNDGPLDCSAPYHEEHPDADPLPETNPATNPNLGLSRTGPGLSPSAL